MGMIGGSALAPEIHSTQSLHQIMGMAVMATAVVHPVHLKCSMASLGKTHLLGTTMEQIGDHWTLDKDRSRAYAQLRAMTEGSTNPSAQTAVSQPRLEKRLEPSQ